MRTVRVWHLQTESAASRDMTTGPGSWRSGMPKVTLDYGGLPATKGTLNGTNDVRRGVGGGISEVPLSLQCLSIDSGW